MFFGLFFFHLTPFLPLSTNVERGTGGEVSFRVRTGVAPLSVEGEAGVQPQPQERNDKGKSRERNTNEIQESHILPF
jgi:hypothetical protein